MSNRRSRRPATHRERDTSARGADQAARARRCGTGREHRLRSAPRRILRDAGPATHRASACGAPTHRSRREWPREGEGRGVAGIGRRFMAQEANCPRSNGAMGQCLSAEQRSSWQQSLLRHVTSVSETEVVVQRVTKLEAGRRPSVGSLVRPGELGEGVEASERRHAARLGAPSRASLAADATPPVGRVVGVWPAMATGARGHVSRSAHGAPVAHALRRDGVFVRRAQASDATRRSATSRSRMTP
jgi:hypothetical protein